jgi:hypothetical protein
VLVAARLRPEGLEDEFIGVMKRTVGEGRRPQPQTPRRPS